MTALEEGTRVGDLVLRAGVRTTSARSVRITWFLKAGRPQRSWLLRPHEKLVAIIETAPRGRTLDETGRLLPGLRLG